METRNTTEAIHEPTAEQKRPEADKTDSDVRVIPGTHAVPLAFATCECPPGCVGLPCCT